MSNLTDLGNRKNEVLLDVIQVGDTNYWYVYDISHYLPHYNCRERANYLERVVFTIKGSILTFHFIDYWETGNDDIYRQLATKYAKEDYTLHRLD